jgi:hypothetical protein
METPKWPSPPATCHQLLAPSGVSGIIPACLPLGVLMRLASVFILCVTLLSASCSDEIADREAAEAAVDEASIAVQCQLITSSLADIAATTPGGATAPLRAEALASGTRKLLDCGTVEAQGSAVALSFGGLGCLINGQRLWGEVLIDVTDMPAQAQLTLSQVTDSGLSVTGESTLTLGEGIRTITDDASVTLTGDDAITYAYLDQRSEVISVTGVTVEAGTRCSVNAFATIGCVFSDSGEAICAEPDGDCRTVTSQGAVLLRAWDIAVGGAQALHPHVVGLNNRTREVDLDYTVSEPATGSGLANVTIDTTVWEVLKTATAAAQEDSDDDGGYTYERVGEDVQAPSSFTFGVYLP